MEVNKVELLKYLSGLSYSEHGDKYEVEYNRFICKEFPLIEEFWKYFVAPQTKRIEAISDKDKYSIYKRDESSDSIYTIACQHYSVFLNIIYAFQHLNNTQISSFEDFYIHLGSICDLSEDFFVNYYLLSSECKNTQLETFKTLSKRKFVKYAKSWYKDNYKNIYKYYLKKGKSMPIYLPTRNNILKECFNNSNEWNSYTKYSQFIKEYRNIIVHNIQIGSITASDGINYVPKKDKIQKYKTWQNVFSVLKNPTQFKKDFIPRNQQMDEDFKSILNILNPLWKLLLDDYLNLLNNNNSILLRHFCLIF